MITKPVITRPVTTTPVVGGDIVSRSSNDNAMPTGGSSPLNTLRAAGERARQELGGVATDASAFNAFAPNTMTDETPYSQAILQRAWKGAGAQTGRYFDVRMKLAEQASNDEYRRDRMIGELADMALRKEASDADISQKWINYKLQERQMEEQEAHNIESEQNYRDQIEARAQGYDANAQAKMAQEEAKTARDDKKNMMNFVGDYVKQKMIDNDKADRNTLIQEGTKLWNDMQASMNSGTTAQPNTAIVPPAANMAGAMAAGAQMGMNALTNAPILQRPQPTQAPAQQEVVPPQAPYDPNRPEGYIPERPGFMSMSAPGQAQASTENPLSRQMRPLMRQYRGGANPKTGLPKEAQMFGVDDSGSQIWIMPDGSSFLMES